jgi:hydrogenase maturation protein HypF
VDGEERAGRGRGARRSRLVCRGAVQGVGFRPSVHRLAADLALTGWVRNGPEGAVVEIEGPEERIEEFLARFPRELPPLARLESWSAAALLPEGSLAFDVLESELGPRAGALVPPDAALCADCRREMDDRSDRRHRYPFTTCTNCGPRFSLCSSFPYDRERTSMACFPLCPDCATEYRDPGDRRFHAEPVSCPACGPRLDLLDASGAVEASDAAAIRAARAALERGAIVAVKGLGGFQLACRADLPAPLTLLRERKRRPTKPFALMVRDLGVARRLVTLSPEDEALLASPRAPVVLAARRRPSPLPDEVAPGIEDLGVMLPTTPLHVELLREPASDALVMTSGNAGDEPICRGNREAVARLAGIADVYLVHDRDVVRRVDDSVVRSFPGGPAVVVRRSRGFVPEPVPLADPAPVPVLALGGHLQVTACLASDDQAFPSQHVGDLDTEPARAFLVEVAEGLEEFLEARAQAVAVDQHPDYPGAWIGEDLAKRRGARLIRLQHHLAHAASVLAEHGAFPAPDEAAAAIVLDGTGWGPDGTAWGGEWLSLQGDLVWQRRAHLEEIPLVGGERAVREPWRVLAAALAKEGASGLLSRLPVAERVPPDRLEEIARLAMGGAWPLAAGAGRLFEAAGALMGLAAVNGWEGEAAVRLESLAAPHPGEPENWPEVRLRDLPHGPMVPGTALLAAAAARAASGEDPSRVASGFHATFCSLATEAAVRVFPRGTRVVALGGGCLVNRILLRGLAERLGRAGFDVRTPRSLPPGDGGLSHGQAVLAALALSRGREPMLKGVS